MEHIVYSNANIFPETSKGQTRIYAREEEKIYLTKT